MKELKLRALALGAAEVLTRAQMKNVLGGDDPILLDGGGAPQCGSPSDAGGCSTATCIAQSGTCKGYSGTCGSSNHNTACTCAVTC